MGLSMFFVGALAMVVQLLLMRELLASFSGNELTLGAAFAVWFLAISVGALGGRRMARIGSSDAVRFLLGILLLALAVLPPVLLFLMVRSREVMGLSSYESPPFGVLFKLLVLVLSPVCIAQGMAFPCACRLAAEGRRQGVSRIYGLESVGSLVGGLGFGLAVLAGAPPLSAALAAGALGFAALAASRIHHTSRVLWALAALVIGVVAFWVPLAVQVQAAWEAPRWSGVAGGKGIPVLARVETPYQRLTVVSSGFRQAVLYGNNQPLFMFPDPVEAEPLIHGILARNEEARRILLIGGNPRDLGRALLAHPGVRVTYVEADPWVWRLTAGPDFPAPADRGRFRVVSMDPVWYARQADEAAFDIVLLMAPEPETVGLNRFYTVEFYRSLRRLIKPDGFLWTSVEASEQLRAETGLLAASVLKTFQACFPSVQVTFGARIGFFASSRPGGVSMDRGELAAAASRAAVASDHFKPESFLADESVDPVKRERTLRALEAIPAPVNTLRHPVTHTFMLLRWNRFSNSRLNRILWALEGLDGGRLARRLSAGMAAGALLLTAALLGWKGRKRTVVVRGSLRLAIAVAGFTAMAYELILIFLAQSLFGYVYERLAFITALFMIGLAGGALAVRRFETADSRAAWSLSIAAFALAGGVGTVLPLWLESGAIRMPPAEWLLHGFMVAAGASVGVLFPMVNRLLREHGEALTASAGETHAADNLGAAFGALAVGVVLIPALGVMMACYVVALANAWMALVLAAAGRKA